jgi:hypothetical protein
VNVCDDGVLRFNGGGARFNGELRESSCIWNVVVGDWVVALLTPVAELVLALAAPAPLLAGAPGVCACTVGGLKQPKVIASTMNVTLLLNFLMYTLLFDVHIFRVDGTMMISVP